MHIYYSNFVFFFFLISESVTEALKCVAKIVKNCAKEEFKYIQKLLDLERTKNALDFGCSRNWSKNTTQALKKKTPERKLKNFRT